MITRCCKQLLFILTILARERDLVQDSNVEDRDDLLQRVACHNVHFPQTSCHDEQKIEVLVGKRPDREEPPEGLELTKAALDKDTLKPKFVALGPQTMKDETSYSAPMS